MPRPELLKAKATILDPRAVLEDPIPADGPPLVSVYEIPPEPQTVTM